MANNIISLNLSTKIQYSLFNFFAPIAMVAIFVCSLELYNFKSTLFGFLSVIIGLFCLFFNLIKYNKYLNINDDSIILCSGKIKKPKVLKIIKKSELQSMQIGFDFSIEYNAKKIKLLNITPSILGVICWIGPLVFIPILKIKNVLFDKLTETKLLIPEIIIPDNIKQPSKTTNIITDLLMWVFVFFVSAVGCLGIFMMPFYAFMG